MLKISNIKKEKGKFTNAEFSIINYQLDLRASLITAIKTFRTKGKPLVELAHIQGIGGIQFH